MSQETPVSELKIGDEISAGITVRGQGVTEASGIALASGALDAWQRAQGRLLSTGLRFEPSDSFADKEHGEHTVRRTLKMVRTDENPK